ncbi:alginate O-acetyltransferase AlgX-related protein [Amphritea sp. HPY]|uniref:alginate O-acetyltransferase AlgX-related protein n=1 Tax=Amphritea sp. HPY TaxID=3421652 RepID=UPI003D7D3247
MADFHRFNLILVSVVTIISAILVATSLYLDKSAGGNMTRLGGYSENDYGWNKPQHAYAKPLYQSNKGNYHEHSDLVVLGDSFSGEIPTVNWVNYFVDRTGVSTQVFSFNQGGIERIISSSVFRQTPPKYLVIESIEESIYRRFPNRNCQVSEQKLPAKQHYDTKLANDKLYQTNAFKRETYQQGLNLDNAGNYLIKAIPRALGLNVSDVTELALTRDDLFSSRVKDNILIYTTDIEKRNWPEDSSATTACNLLNLQQRIEANGYTKVVIMVIPDKLTAYSEVLANESLSQLSIIPGLAKQKSLNLIRLDLLLKEEVAQGTVDIYLPNDTHWSSAGYRLGAEAMIDYFNTTAQPFD